MHEKHNPYKKKYISIKIRHPVLVQRPSSFKHYCIMYQGCHSYNLRDLLYFEGNRRCYFLFIICVYLFAWGI